jgi:hypothetical protein
VFNIFLQSKYSTMEQRRLIMESIHITFLRVLGSRVFISDWETFFHRERGDLELDTVILNLT